MTKYPKLEKNHAEGAEGTIAGAYTWPGRVLFPLARVENLIIQRASGRVLRRVLPH